MLVNSIYGLIVFSRNRKDTINFSFFILTISISMWGLTMFGYRGFTDHEVVLWMSRLLYFSAITIPISFIYFVIIFPNPNTRLTKIQKYVVPVVPAVLCLAALLPNFFIRDVIIYPDKESFIVFNLFWQTFFGLYVVAYFSWAYIVILKKYIAAKGVLKAQLAYIFVGTFSSTVITLITNLTLLHFGYFGLNWLGQIGVIVMITLIFYSILKFRLFNVKVITTELFTFALWIFILIRFFLSETTQDKIINAILLIFVVGVGTLLIRSVIKEVRQREKIEKLAQDLEKANIRLTDLDRQKSEFVSFATHQLRAPLTAMKGYASLILEGDMGAIAPQGREAVGRIFESTNTLASIVDDYLNLTRIELGSMKYMFETIDLKTLVDDVIGELKPNIDKATNVKFSFSAQNSGTDYRTTADRDKLKQVIANLIDNSIKYTPKGTVDVSLSYDRPRHKFVFMIKDTGIGIASETLPHLFAKFSRAGNANKTNIRGTGLGLFVAKEIIVAHHGSIRAESPGEGKGSSFIVELEPFAKA
ncbi:MAG: ATP-binding protein [Patescibacteria group bacterium]